MINKTVVLAVSRPRQDSRSDADGISWVEYSIRPFASDAERRAIHLMHANKDVWHSDAVILQSQTIRSDGDAGSVNGLDIQTIHEAVHAFLEGDYWDGYSVHPAHARAVEWRCACSALLAELHAARRDLESLPDEAQDGFETVMRQARLWHKPSRNSVKVDLLKKEALDQFYTARDDLMGIVKTLRAQFEKLSGEKPRLEI